MTVHNMRETFIRENSLYTLLDIEELLGKRLLWDLSSIWFRFNVKFPRHIWARIKAAKGLRARQIVIAMEFLKSQNIHVELVADGRRNMMKARSGGTDTNGVQCALIAQLEAAGYRVITPPGEFDQFAAAEARDSPMQTFALTVDSTDQAASGANVVEHLDFHTGKAKLILMSVVLNWMKSRFRQGHRNDEQYREFLLDVLAYCAAVASNDYNHAARIRGISFMLMMKKMIEYAKTLRNGDKQPHELFIMIVRTLFSEQRNRQSVVDQSEDEILPEALINCTLAYVQFRYPVSKHGVPLSEQPMPVDRISGLMIENGKSLKDVFPAWWQLFCVLGGEGLTADLIPFQLADSAWIENNVGSCRFYPAAAIEKMAVYFATTGAEDLPPRGHPDLGGLVESMKLRTRIMLYRSVGREYDSATLPIELEQVEQLLELPAWVKWMKDSNLTLLHEAVLNGEEVVTEEIWEQVKNARKFSFATLFPQLELHSATSDGTFPHQDSEFGGQVRRVKDRLKKTIWTYFGRPYRLFTCVALEPEEARKLLQLPDWVTWMKAKKIHSLCVAVINGEWVPEEQLDVLDMTIQDERSESWRGRFNTFAQLTELPSTGPGFWHTEKQAMKDLLLGIENGKKRVGSTLNMERMGMLTSLKMVEAWMRKSGLWGIYLKRKGDSSYEATEAEKQTAQVAAGVAMSRTQEPKWDKKLQLAIEMDQSLTVTKWKNRQHTDFKRDVLNYASLSSSQKDRLILRGRKMLDKWPEFSEWAVELTLDVLFDRVVTGGEISEEEKADVERRHRAYKGRRTAERCTKKAPLSGLHGTGAGPTPAATISAPLTIARRPAPSQQAQQAQQAKEEETMQEKEQEEDTLEDPDVILQRIIAMNQKSAKRLTPMTSAGQDKNTIAGDTTSGTAGGSTTVGHIAKRQRGIALSRDASEEYFDRSTTGKNTTLRKKRKAGREEEPSAAVQIFVCMDAGISTFSLRQRQLCFYASVGTHSLKLDRKPCLVYTSTLI